MKGPSLLASSATIGSMSPHDYVAYLLTDCYELDLVTLQIFHTITDCFFMLSYDAALLSQSGSVTLSYIFFFPVSNYVCNIKHTDTQ